MKIRDIQIDPYGLWVFDNDGTLYRNTSCIREAVEKKMNSFIAEYFRIEFEAAEEKRRELLKQHQTTYTLIAMRHEGVDPNVFLNATYLSVVPEEYGITKNDELREVICNLTGEKVVLTNNPSQFASLILDSLGISDLFSHVYGMMEISFMSKPHKRAFDVIARAVDCHRSVVYVDDQLDNVLAVHSMGVETILAYDPAQAKCAPGYYAASLSNGEVYHVGASSTLMRRA